MVQKGARRPQVHLPFTARIAASGYLVAAIKHPHLRDWLKMKIRLYYHERSKHGRKENADATDAPPQEPKQEAPQQTSPAEPTTSPSESPTRGTQNGEKRRPAYKIGPIACDKNTSVECAVWRTRSRLVTSGRSRSTT